MKKEFTHIERKGLPGGPNEMFTYVTGVFSTEGYKRNSPDVSNPFNIIPSGSITMKDVDFPVMGTDNLGNSEMMMPGNDYQFPGDQVFEVPMAQTGYEVPKRQGVRDNGDGSESTHLMATETFDNKNWFSFPTLFQDPDGTWIDMSTKPWKEAYKEAQRRGEVIDFGTDKESAIKFGKGSWKPKMKRGGGLLTKTMKCNDCGWSWKAADGGKDISTCHKCGGSALPKAQEGKDIDNTYYTNDPNQPIQLVDPSFEPTTKPKPDRPESNRSNKINYNFKTDGLVEKNNDNHIITYDYITNEPKWVKGLRAKQPGSNYPSTFNVTPEQANEFFNNAGGHINVNTSPNIQGYNVVAEKESLRWIPVYKNNKQNNNKPLPKHKVQSLDKREGASAKQVNIEKTQEIEFTPKPELPWYQRTGFNSGLQRIQSSNYDPDSPTLRGEPFQMDMQGNIYQSGGSLPKAQVGKETEEKSVWGFIKEMAKIPGADISNLLGVMGIPANLIAEAAESLTGRGDGEFNFMDAMPSIAIPGSDDEIFTFTNQNGTPIKDLAGLEDAEGNPLVENPVGAFLLNMGADPSTYVGAGIAKNVINKVTQGALKRGLKGGIKYADDAISNVYKYNPMAYNNINSKLPEFLQLNKNNEKWLRQVGKTAIDDAQATRTVREIGEKIDPEAFALKLEELKNQPIGQFSLSKRYPGPFFKKGETFFKYNKTARQGLDGLRNTRGRSGSADFLIEFNPSDPTKYKNMDSYFQPAYMQRMDIDPKPFNKFVGDIAIMKPKMRDVDNFDFYKKDWLKGYKKTPLDKLQNGNGEYTVESGNTFDGIANKKEVSKNLLRNMNPGIDYNDIKVGQVINVPDIKTKEERMQFFSDRRNTPMDAKDSPGISKIQTAISNGSTKQENPSYNKDILIDLSKVDKKELSKQQAERRQSLFNAANTVASVQGNNKDLEKLLVMSAVMENTLGIDDDAYGRNYTRGPMSIDNIAYKDLFEIRKGATKYTTQQKKNTAWLESLGINTSDIDSALRSDDPLTSMAVARLVYGRAPEALPSGDDPDALYNYYLKYYNKTGVDKYGGAEAHRDRFNDYYSEIYKELGGEVNEFQVYANYINGSYNGTEMETKAEKIYDKLNRVYYRKAKALDMSAPNYIMSNIINRSGQ